MQAVASLAPGQAFRFLATFEPAPLYAVLGRKGFAHHATHRGAEEGEILFSPDPALATAPQPPRAAPDRHAAAAGWPTRPASPACSSTWCGPRNGRRGGCRRKRRPIFASARTRNNGARAAGVGGAARLGYVPPLAPAPLEAGLSPFAGADHGQYRDDRGRGSRASR